MANPETPQTPEPKPSGFQRIVNKVRRFTASFNHTERTMTVEKLIAGGHTELDPEKLRQDNAAAITRDFSTSGSSISFIEGAPAASISSPDQQEAFNNALAKNAALSPKELIDNRRQQATDFIKDNTPDK